MNPDEHVTLTLDDGTELRGEVREGDPMSTPIPSIPGVDRDGLIEAILRAASIGPVTAGRAANAALAYIADHHKSPTCTCGAKYDRCPDCTSDDAYEQGRKDAACDREHADEWVEVDEGTFYDLPVGARVRQEWRMGTPVDRRSVHRDDMPDPDPDPDPRALIARELGPAKADTFLGLLDEHGWTVTRKEER